ncbi:MAG: hypothetical protein KAU21_10395 [Gammaproteobacteria bacterium]|nr:hypothetical protein [Gammaproteobacteria bacterium]
MSESISGSFCIQYYDSSELDKVLKNNHVFAVFQFANETTSYQNDPRLITLALPQLNENKLIEVWTSNEELTQSVEGECCYHMTDSFLFISVQIDESRFENISEATQHAYSQVTALKQRLGYVHNTRMWNYFPGINRETQGNERYKQFCEGRHVVLADQNEHQKNFSAASAIGSHAPGLVVLSLSSNQPVSHVENPRQMSAYHYPKDYGKTSPSFARATSLKIKMTDHLYVSGTASITGHQSQHHDDVEKQTQLSLDNIEVLLNHAHKKNETFPVTIDSLSLLKVYIRHAEDYSVIKDILHRRSQQKVPILFLQGDICRSELLVEVEALYIQNCDKSQVTP